MQNVKLLADLVDVARRAEDRWYVTIGHAAVGPVNLDLLARGVEAGKVPLEAFVRHEQWKVWRPLSELAVIDGGAAHGSTDDVADPGRPSTPTDFRPDDASWLRAPEPSPSLEGIADPPGERPRALSDDRRDALTLLMTAAVARGGADAAIVHEVDDEGAVAVCAHGPSRWEALGLHTPRLDPAVVAAETGATIVAQPARDAADATIVDHLSRLVGPVGGALLLPIRAHGRLVGMIEIGRRAPFHAAEIASLEALVEALVHKLERWGV